MLAIPAIHLDCHYWNPGWVETPPEQWQLVHARLLEQPHWIIDGNYGGTMAARLAAADTVIFLDLSRWRCLGRVIKRRWQYHRCTRPDVAAGCPEQLSLEFLLWIWRYSRQRRPKILERMGALGGEQVAIHLRGSGAVHDFIQALEASMKRA